MKRIWGDPWLPTPTTFTVQSPVHFLGANATVYELIDQDTKWWNRDLVEKIFSPEEVAVINTVTGKLL
jgi:hypothetical protein